MKMVVLFFIAGYRKIKRAILPSYSICKFNPTCSKYAYEAVEKYGTIKGSYLAIKRILRCNPFSKGGYDPLR